MYEVHRHILGGKIYGIIETFPYAISISEGRVHGTTTDSKVAVGLVVARLEVEHLD